MLGPTTDMNNLWEQWTHTTARHPHRIVVIEADTGRSMSCRELTDAASRYAETLPVGGSQTRFALRFPNGLDWLIAFLAIQKKRHIAIPIDPSVTGDAQSRLARTIGAHILIDPSGITALHPAAPPTHAVHRHACCAKVSSGSTGEPNLVWCRPTHLLSDGIQIMSTMGIRSSDRNLAVIPLGHSYGLGNLVMPLILRAVPIVVTRDLLSRHLLHVMDRHQVTVFPSVPAVLRVLANTPAAHKPSSLRLVISAGAPLAPVVAEQFHQRFGLKIHNFYGASETGGICYDRTGNATLTGRSIGKPLRGVTVHVRTDGRVAVRSPAVAMPRTRHVLQDMAVWTPAGELNLLGRLGEMANIGGKKVSPAELERSLRALPGVTDAWVTVKRDRHQHDYLAAAVETFRSIADIEHDLARHLPAWKLPKRYHLAPTLPRTDRGKLDTGLLRALFPS